MSSIIEGILIKSLTTLKFYLHYSDLHTISNLYFSLILFNYNSNSDIWLSKLILISLLFFGIVN